MSEAHSRRERLQSLDTLLENEAPYSWGELKRESALKWGVTENTLLGYLDTLGYHREDRDGDVKVVAK
jgi:hypothetical protein